VIALYFLGCKIRRFKDNFHVIKEMNAITIFFSVYIASYPCLLLFLSLAGYSTYIRGVFVILQSNIAFIVAMYLQTVYVLNMVKSDKTLQLKFNQSLNSESGNAIIESTGIRDKQSRNSLVDILRDIDMFESFMQHLAKEWSMELLLALVEFTQFQHQIKEYGKDTNSKNMDFSSIQQALIENTEIPSSYIVHHNNMADIVEECNVTLTEQYDADDEMIQFKIRGCALYSKYIIGNDLEINISYRDRNTLRAIMGDSNYFLQNVNMNHCELFSLFKDSISELEKLLKYSYTRFNASLKFVD